MATKTNADYTSVTLSGNQDIDAILSPSKWASTNLTFSFPDTYEEYTGFFGAKASFSKFSDQAKTTAREALKLFEHVSLLSFTEWDETTTDHYNIRFANTSDSGNTGTGTAFGLFPNWNGNLGGDMEYNSTKYPSFANPSLGTYAYYTTMHEIGHVLGLGHGHTPDPNNFNGQLPAGHNSIEYSIMTYRSYESAPADSNIYATANNFSQSLMMNDIAALQYLYGAWYGYQADDTIYTFSEKDGTFYIDGASQGKPAANVIFRTIWDGGGNDTYDFSNFTSDQTIDLQAGKYSVLNKAQLADLDNASTSNNASGNVYNALLYEGKLDSLIENAAGGKGNDTITGNELSNILDGGAGNDKLFGLEGNDKLFGGKGTNELNGGDGLSDFGLFNFSRYTYTKSGTTDVVYTGSGASAGEITTVKSDVENVLFNVERIGGDLVYNTTKGVTKAFVPVSKEAQTLHLNDDGFSSAIDISSVFEGGSLNFFGTNYSSLYVNNNGNITFNGGLATYTPGSIPGSGSAIIAPFWGDVDTRLKSTQSGFANGKVQWDLDEVHGSFTATWSNVNYYNSTSTSNTPKFNNFQLQLVDQGSGDFEIIFRYGAVNWTTGTASGGNNQGLGGTVARAGFTSGDGGYGEYYELTSSGNQQQMLALDTAIGNTGIAGVWQWRVSNGAIKGIGGDNGDTLDGDGLPNYIDGRGGDDFLNGLGGADTLIGGGGNDQLTGAAGPDKLFGGAGNDNYIINDALDTIVELAGEGTKDTVQSGVNFVLKAYSQVNVENLVLIGNAVNGTGNETGNEITGNDKNNTLNGGGGGDTLDGGIGDDTLNGGDGLDFIKAGPGKDKIDGGAGFDEVHFSSTVTVNLTTPADNTGDAAGDTYANIELFVGSSGADKMVGNAVGNGFFGADGDDILHGNGGNDGLEGGKGNDEINGGDGVDQVTFQHSDSGITIALHENLAADVSGGDAAGDTILNVENVTGSNFNDVMTADSKANFFEGLNGNDTFKGSTSGPGDKFNGGNGSDTMDYSVGATGITIQLNAAGNATGFGGMAAGDTLISIENLIGTDGNDFLYGNAGANKIEGRGGDDVIRGYGGGDNLDGGTGANDTVSYQGVNVAVTATLGETGVTKNGTSSLGVDLLVNFENLVGGIGSDVLTGNSNVNIIEGGDGNDTIEGGGSSDTLRGQGGIDTVSYALAAAAVTVNLSLLTGQLGTGAVGEDSFGDTLSGFENIVGSNNAGDDLTGTDGNNVIEGLAGADTMSGKLGVDTLSYKSSNAAVTVTLHEGSAADAAGGHAAGDQAFNFENVTGSDFNDILGGDSRVNILNGGNGLDTATYAGSKAVTITLNALGIAVGAGGLAAGDILISIENLTGGDGNDKLTGNDGVNVIMGGKGDDIIQGNGGGDTLDGGAGGLDTVSYANSDNPVSVTLGIGGAETSPTSGDAQGDKISNFENVTGSAYGDILNGNETTNVIVGGGGDDIIEGGASSDNLAGGGGIDTVSYASSSQKVDINLNLAVGKGQLGGGDGTGDQLSGFENLVGSAHDDNLTGTDLANLIEGGAGADTMSGRLGSDTLSYIGSSAGVTVSLNGGGSITGQGGDAQGDQAFNFENIIGSNNGDKLSGELNLNIVNTIKGGAGDDVITGGLGADILWGQGNNDTFFYNSLAERGDTIKDFAPGFDHLEFKASGFQNSVAAPTVFKSGTGAIPAPDAGNFNAIFLYDRDDGRLYYDDDGVGAHVRTHVLTLEGSPDNLLPTDIILV